MESLLRISEGFLMPSEVLLSQLTGKQWANLREIYSKMPTPLERIEWLLTLVIKTFSSSEFEGSIIPDRFDIYQTVADKDKTTKQEEEAIVSNLHMFMTFHNAVRGGK